MFYVIDKNTGHQVFANGFWAIRDDGKLIDVVDGWGLEGGGGSNDAPENFAAVLGYAPLADDPEPEKFECFECEKKFNTESGRMDHMQIKHWKGVQE